MGRAIERSPALDGLSSRILKAHTKIVSAAWTMATSEDYRWPVTKGAPANRATRIGHAYMDHVLDLAPHDFEVAKTFVHVMNMLAPPTSLFRPRILIQVLWRILRRKQPTQRRGPFPELPPEIARLVRNLPKQRVSAVEPR